jgi:hypothetical protein
MRIEGMRIKTSWGHFYTSSRVKYVAAALRQASCSMGLWMERISDCWLLTSWEVVNLYTEAVVP